MHSARLLTIFGLGTYAVALGLVVEYVLIEYRVLLGAPLISPFTWVLLFPGDPVFAVPALVVMAIGLALARHVLLRVAATLFALAMITPGFHLILGPSAMSDELLGAAGAWLIAVGYAPLLAAPWMAQRTLRWTGTILLVSAVVGGAGKLALYSLYTGNVDPGPGLPGILLGSAALTAAGVFFLTRSPTPRKVALLLAALAPAAGVLQSYEPALLSYPWVAWSLRLQVAASVSLVLAWMVPMAARWRANVGTAS